VKKRIKPLTGLASSDWRR